MAEIVKQFIEGPDIVKIYREVTKNGELYYETRTPVPVEETPEIQAPPTPEEFFAPVLADLAAIKADIAIIKTKLGVTKSL